MNATPVTASPRVRRAFLWVGSAVTVLALASVLFNLVNAVAWNTYVVQREVARGDLHGVRTVEIDNSAGATEVVGGGDGGMVLRSEVIDGIFSADHDYRLHPERLVITGNCRFGFATNCRVDHHVELPEALALVLHNRHGDLSVTGTSGPIRASTRFGEVTIAGASGPVEVESRFGTVRLRELTSPQAQVDLRFGDLEAGFAEAPEDLTIAMRFGDVVIEVPDDGTTYAVTGTSSFGERHVEVRTDPDSEHRIHVDHRYGNLTIRHPH